MIESKIELILKRDQLSQLFKTVDKSDSTIENFNRHSDIFARYRRVNAELFDFDFLKYLEGFNAGDVLFEFDNGDRIECSSAMTFNGKGVKLISAEVNE